LKTVTSEGRVAWGRKNGKKGLRPFDGGVESAMVVSEKEIGNAE